MLDTNRAAIYCRLSKEDGNDESQSISNQKSFLEDYVKKQGWYLFDIYIDDGYSGTNFERPSFQRLISDIEYGKIDIVVTKDLSRLGRNYIQTGYYTEEYFPNKNVRYIAINDNFDTSKIDSNNFAPFKNIINEWYAKDISKKIRFTLDNMAKKGTPKRTVFPLFGYAFNEASERVIDSDTAPIVKLIFKKFIEMCSCSKVARWLKENNIKRPCYYNAIKYNYNKEKVLALSEEKLCSWRNDVIKDILTNIEYTGAYITAKSTSRNYKDKKRKKSNINRHIFYNRYPAIIDKFTFERIQNMLIKQRGGKVDINENLYKGLIRCADCESILRFEKRETKRKGVVKRYYCYKKNCKSFNTIQIKYLNEIVKINLLNLKNCILKKKKEFIEFINNFDTKGRYIKINLQDDLNKHIKRNNELDNYIQMLFEEKNKNNIPESTYEVMINKYKKEKEILKELIDSLKSRIEQEKLKFATSEKTKLIISILENINEDNVLDPRIIRSCIKSIYVKIGDEIKPKKYVYNIAIRYMYLDNEIKEFLENGDE